MNTYRRVVLHILIFLCGFSLYAQRSVRGTLYQELVAVIARNLDSDLLGVDEFRRTVLNHAPHAQHGLSWLEKSGDYSVFSARIEQLLAELKWPDARYYTKQDDGYEPLRVLLKHAPVYDEIKNRSGSSFNSAGAGTEQIYHYAHVLSDESILVLPPVGFTASAPAGSEAGAARLVVHFFGSATCGECHEIRATILNPLSVRYADKLEILIHDIDDEKGFTLLDAMEKAYQVKVSLPIQLYLPDTALAGADMIERSAHALIVAYLGEPDKWAYRDIDTSHASSGDILRDRFSRFTFLGVLVAGLIDGINPCAIATMIFLISFLAARKRSRSEVLAVGLSFTGAVFVTYLLLGLGAFKVLTMLQSYRWLSLGVKWVAVGVAGGLGLLSFYDAIAYALSRNARAITLQLPKAVKMRIHQVVSKNLSGRQLITGAIVTGFLVTLLEAVCTGQVYLPTIVLMTRHSGLRLSGWLYLIFYNFLFVLPLLVIMIMACFGLRWQTLSGATQKHLPLLKVLLGIVLVSLAVFLGIAM